MGEALTFITTNPLMIICSFLLMSVLGAIVYFDFRFLIIPNWINVGLLIFGLAISAMKGLDALLLAIIVSFGIAVFFYGVAFSYAKFRKREGLGMGDVKFLAAASTWVGVTGLPWLLLIASSAALVHALIVGIGGGKFDATTRLPFGPHLAMGLLLVWHVQQFDLLSGVLL